MVHFRRNLLAPVPKRDQATVAAVVRTVFQQANRAEAEAALERVGDALAASSPKVVEVLLDAEGEVVTCSDFPAEHRRPLASTNPLERLNKELKRRRAVVGIFPNRLAAIRLLGAVLDEQHEEWLVGRHSFSEASLRKLLAPNEEPLMAQFGASAV